MTKYQIKIKLKEGIKDIEAETLMTFVDASDGIRSIKTGSIYYVEAEDDANIEEFVKEYLINDQLDEYEIIVDKSVNLKNAFDNCDCCNYQRYFTNTNKFDNCNLQLSNLQSGRLLFLQMLVLVRFFWKTNS